MNSRPKIAVIDIGMGNLFSIQKALLHHECELTRARRPEDLAGVHGVVLPGVGAFGRATEILSETGLGPAIMEHVKSDGRILGVCLGMQLLFDESEEFGRFKGLGLVAGRVRPLRDVVHPGTKVPLIGWLDCVLTPAGQEDPMFKSFLDGTRMYFLHSFFADPESADDILATANYGDRCFCAAVRRDSVFGVQFHPEKSAEAGLALYGNFVDACRDRL